MQGDNKKGNCTNHMTTNTVNAHNQSPHNFRMDALKTYLIKDEPDPFTTCCWNDGKEQGGILMALVGHLFY